MICMVVVKAAPVGRGPSVDPEIGRQRVESLAKDAEARGKVGNGGIFDQVLLREHMSHPIFVRVIQNSWQSTPSFSSKFTESF